MTSTHITYEGCPESIQPFWISREPATLPWCNLAARGDLTAHLWSVTLRGASKSAVRRRWLRLRTVRLSHSQISSLSTVILALDKVRSRMEPNLCCRGADRFGWCDALPEKPAWKLKTGQDHCHDEADLLARSLRMQWSHSINGQQRLTADWLQLGRVTVQGCTVRSHLTGCHVTSRQSDRFLRY
jgi:hypothetical protein